jgi:glutathione S-transferase
MTAFNYMSEFGAWRCIVSSTVQAGTHGPLMFTFFDYLPSQNAFKVRLLLNHLGTAHRTQLVSIFEGEGKTQEYLRINPTGAVPAILMDDGRALAESNVILTYLADGTRYLPNDQFERAKIAQWLSFEQDYVQNSIGALRYWTLTAKLQSRPKELIEAKRAGGVNALKVLESALSTPPFICGDQYTIADMSIYAYGSRAEEAGIALEPYPYFRAWIARVESQNGFCNTVHPYSIDPHALGELP